MEIPSAFRAGYAAIIGRPNAGKSTLMNRLLNLKLSIVSKRPQTTRQRVMGILNEPGCQIIFLDTPGLIRPKYALQTAMMKITGAVIQSADVILYIADIAAEGEVEFIRSYAKETLTDLPAAKIMILNKIDLIPKPDLLPIIQEIHQWNIFKETVPVSALKGDGIERIKNVLRNYMPLNAPFYPPEQITEQPERFFVAELIREKIFERYSDEIPYATEVLIDEFSERPGRKDYIRAVILVERDSQKKILIGEKGQALKKVGASARKDIETFLDRPVFIELWVKVREDWRKDKTYLSRIGYKL